MFLTLLEEDERLPDDGYRDELDWFRLAVREIFDIPGRIWAAKTSSPKLTAPA